jgi:hypothetical protein
MGVEPFRFKYASMVLCRALGDECICVYINSIADRHLYGPSPPVQSVLESVLELVAFPLADGALPFPVFVEGTQRVYRVGRIEHHDRCLLTQVLVYFAHRMGSV